MLVPAIVIITLTLVLYTIGVWGNGSKGFSSGGRSSSSGSDLPPMPPAPSS